MATISTVGKGCHVYNVFFHFGMLFLRPIVVKLYHMIGN